MITRSDHQRLFEAFVMEECLYFLHPLEMFFQVPWDGVHWHLVELAQQARWPDLKQYMDTMGETYLREEMELVIQTVSPRLYREYWSVCPNKNVVVEGKSVCFEGVDC